MKADSSDALLGLGALLTAAAVAGLAGVLWATGWLGALLLVAGIAKARG